ncbi:MAG: membrane protein insertion efficiency factor YidD [Candidatus Hydrogenedentes bacterium]|nr:membrane protein insertion efficiency factor YidD [Candidatus Hydrogenedentota bacterium]
MVKVLVGIIRLYQRWLSPWLGQNCRFYPSCSQYAIDALRTHGVVYGLLLGAWRILRCNPFCRGGHDPVPEKRHGH